MTGLDVAFAAVGLIAATSGLLAVTTRHVVHAALWLVVCLGSIAGCYLVLGAEFVALVQVLLYVGAVVVLVLFALMLTRAPIGPHAEIATSRLHRVLAALLGAGTTAMLAAVLLPLAAPVSRTETDTTELATRAVRHLGLAVRAAVPAAPVALVAALAVSRIAGRGEAPTGRAHHSQASSPEGGTP